MEYTQINNNMEECKINPEQIKYIRIHRHKINERYQYNRGYKFLWWRVKPTFIDKGDYEYCGSGDTTKEEIEASGKSYIQNHIVLFKPHIEFYLIGENRCRVMWFEDQGSLESFLTSPQIKNWI